MRRPGGLRVLLYGAGLVALVVIAVFGRPAVEVFQLLRDDASVDRIVLMAALDWRDFGPEAARERLMYELDHQGVSHHVRDEQCALTKAGDELRVACAWGVRVHVPGLDLSWPLSFESVARVGGDGAVIR